MCRNELVLLGDVFDFLEWRRIHKGIPYKQPQSIRNPAAQPAARFYNKKGRLYSVSNKGGRSRLSSNMKDCAASRISCFGFGDNKNTFITVVRRPEQIYRDFLIRIRSPRIDICVCIEPDHICSVFEDGTTVQTMAFVENNKVVLAR